MMRLMFSVGFSPRLLQGFMYAFLLNKVLTTFVIFFTYLSQGFLRKGITTNNLYYISLQK